MTITRKPQTTNQFLLSWHQAESKFGAGLSAVYCSANKRGGEAEKCLLHLTELITFAKWKVTQPLAVVWPSSEQVETNLSVTYWLAPSSLYEFRNKLIRNAIQQVFVYRVQTSVCSCSTGHREFPAGVVKV